MEMTLCAADIPGAELAEPFEKHPVPSLRWWLLCRGIKARALHRGRKKTLLAGRTYIIIFNQEVESRLLILM
jgi:hypothetical protein